MQIIFEAFVIIITTNKLVLMYYMQLVSLQPVFGHLLAILLVNVVFKSTNYMYYVIHVIQLVYAYYI